MNLVVRWQNQPDQKTAKEIEDKIKGVLKEHGLIEKVELNISFVDKPVIKDLNLRFRGIDKATDVLSFPLEKELGPDGVIRLGDIVVCPEAAEGQSQEFLILHGLNHLLGIHH